MKVIDRANEIRRKLEKHEVALDPGSLTAEEAALVRNAIVDVVATILVNRGIAILKGHKSKPEEE